MEPYSDRLHRIRQMIPPPDRTQGVDSLRRFDHEECFGLGYDRERDGVDADGNPHFRRVACKCAMGLTCPTCRGSRKIRRFVGYDDAGKPREVGTGQLMWCPDCCPRGEYSAQDELTAVERELDRLVAEEVDGYVPF